MARPVEATVRKTLLAAQPEFDAYLTYYPAGLEQGAHDHQCSQYSILLAGSLIEQVNGREHRAGPGQASAKPRHIAHADSYGPNGAVLMSFHFRCEEAAASVIGKNDWHWRLALLRPLSGAPRNIDGLWEVLGAAEHRSPSGRPPDWLRWAQARLDGDDVHDIGKLAAEAGVHRVHFSREFVRHFGLTPSAYRQRQMAARALRCLVHDRLPGAAAAQEAGFSDQSHMTRVIRSAFGTTPRRIAALLAS